ncbi:protein FAM200A-like [Huso huso]|uniref:Protein FAM200A-like n=1 Tax=Huso huso TaxID=61971 RepID=A0ABR0YZJ9_HUSHU
MNTVTAIINFIRSTSSLQHRLFRLLLADMSADHHDLLVHNDVRWITKGKALNRFCDLKDEIIEFLNNSSHKNAERYSNMVRDDEFMAKVCFLSDIFGHLNTLNLELQGRDKTIIDLVEKLNAFQSKLSLFSSDLHLQKLLHFPQLRNFTASSSVKVTNVMSDFLIKLKDNFNDRFQDFHVPKEVMMFARSPFTVSPESDFASTAKQFLSSVEEGPLQLELVDIQASSSLKQDLQNDDAVRFWTEHIQQVEFPNARKLAVLLLTMFGSTYTCESSFSHMNVIKSNTRSSLTNERLQHCLRIAVTSYEPNFMHVAQGNKCNGSH